MAALPPAVLARAHPSALVPVLGSALPSSPQRDERSRDELGRDERSRDERRVACAAEATMAALPPAVPPLRPCEVIARDVRVARVATPEWRAKRSFARDARNLTADGSNPADRSHCRPVQPS